MSEFIKLNLISEENREVGTYDERERTYECPCSEGVVVWSKEKPNGSGFGYQATFSDVFWKCKKCEEKYNFMSGSAYLKKES